MKKLLVLAVILSLTAVACDAFKDSYSNQGEGSEAAENEAAPPSGNEAAKPAADYASDTTECTPVEGVTVAISDESGAVTETALDLELPDGTEITATAEALGAFTAKVIIKAGEDELSFALKQTGEKEFAVCEIAYKDLTVKAGTITVDTFNGSSAEDTAKAVNAGAFALEFAEGEETPKTAVSVMKQLAGEEESTKVEGTYFIEGLAVPTEEAAE